MAYGESNGHVTLRGERRDPNIWGAFSGKLLETKTRLEWNTYRKLHLGH